MMHTRGDDSTWMKVICVDGLHFPELHSLWRAADTQEC